MSIVKVELMNENATVSIDAQYRRTYTHDFLITTDNKGYMQPEVLNYSLAGTYAGPGVAIPQLWTPYSSFSTSVGGTGGGFLDDDYVFVQQRNYRRWKEGDWLNWVCTVSWGYPGAFGGGQNGIDSSNPPALNPLSEPVRYHADFAPYQTYVDKEWNYDTGNPNSTTVGERLIANACKDGYNPPLIKEELRPVLIAKRNWDGTDLNGLMAHILAYTNTVNNATFFGWPVRSARVDKIDFGNKAERNGISFYPLTYYIQFNKETWDAPLVNRGGQHFDSNGNKQYPVKLKLKEGSPGGSTDPNDYENDPPLPAPPTFLDFVNLNSDGTRKLPDSEPAEFVSPAFRIYTEADLSGLGIGGV